VKTRVVLAVVATADVMAAVPLAEPDAVGFPTWELVAPRFAMSKARTIAVEVVGATSAYAVPEMVLKRTRRFLALALLVYPHTEYTRSRPFAPSELAGTVHVAIVVSLVSPVCEAAAALRHRT
jgi:hypothetical protein